MSTIRHIYLDVDIGGGDAVSRILSTPGMPNPHHVLETSPGKHQIIWQVEGFDRDQAEELLRGLAAAHQADPAVMDHTRDGPHGATEHRRANAQAPSWRRWSALAERARLEHAMRALEHGDSPSVIQARIEAYRKDKPNPHY